MEKRAVGKRGISHLGFVLGFVIFVMFLVFMYSAVEPVIKTQLSRESLLENLKFNFIDYLKTQGGDVTEMTVTLSGSGTSCAQILSAGIYSSGGMAIKDNSGSIVNYKISSGNILLGVPASYGGILKFYVGANVDSPQNLASANCDPATANVKFEKTEKSVFDSGIISLKENYESAGGYDSLKSALKIPSENDFIFGFDFMNGTAIEPKSVIVPDTNIYAQTFPVQYLDGNANIKMGLLSIKIW